MTRLRVSALIAGFSIIAAANAGAQIVDVKLTDPHAPGGGNVTAFGYYMSPYSGTVDGVMERLNCVDFFHDVTLGESWKAHLTNLGAAILNPNLLSATRDGSNGLFATFADALPVYEEVAWLTDHFPLNPASNPDMSTAIQTAIWQIASNSNNPFYRYSSSHDYWAHGATSTFDASVTNTDQGTTGYWIYQAQQEYSKYGVSYYSKFNILTDININDLGCTNAGQYVCTAQEFIFSTPEPTSVALMATGLCGVLVSARRRRRGQVRSAIDEVAA